MYYYNVKQTKYLLNSKRIVPKNTNAIESDVFNLYLLQLAKKTYSVLGRFTEPNMPHQFNFYRNNNDS